MQRIESVAFGGTSDSVCLDVSNLIILIGKRELIALLNLSSWCLVMVEGLFLAVPGGCLQFVIVVFLDHTHLLFLKMENICISLFTNKQIVLIL